MNKSISICFWCHEPNGELVELKKLPNAQIDDFNDNLDLSYVILNYDPCDKCLDEWSKGIVIIETSSKELVKNMPPINMPANIQMEKQYPTGRYIIIDEKGLDIILNDGPLKDNILKTKRSFMNEDTYSFIFSKNENKSDNK